MAEASSIRKTTMAEQQERIDKTLHTCTAIDSLPSEILEKIFQYLPHFERFRLETVCRKWRQASINAWGNIQSLHLHIPREAQFNPKLKSREEARAAFNVENDEIRLRTDDLQIINNVVMRIGKTVKKFIFDDDTFEPENQDNRKTLSIIRKYCHNIEIMQIKSNHLSLSKRAISKLFKANKKLNSIKSDEEILGILPIKNWKCLWFDRFARRVGAKSDAVEKKLIALIRASPSLETFEMWNCSRNIVAELSKCKELKRLQAVIGWAESVEQIYDVPMLNRLTVLSINCASCETMGNILRQCVNLKVLSVRHEKFSGVADEALEEVVDEFVENLLELPKLEALCIGRWPIGNIHLRSFTNLKHLTLISPYVTMEGALQLITSSKQLETLGVSNTAFAFLPSFLQTIVEETRDRSKILEINVPNYIYKRASQICENSKIQIVKNSDFFTFLDGLQWNPKVDFFKN